MMQHVTQPLDDLVNLPYLVAQLDVQSVGKRIFDFILRKWFKSKKLIRVPIFLKTQYAFSHVVFFMNASVQNTH